MLDDLATILVLVLGIVAVIVGGWLVWTRRHIVARLIVVLLGVMITLFSFGAATDLSEDASQEPLTPAISMDR